MNPARKPSVAFEAIDVGARKGDIMFLQLSITKEPIHRGMIGADSFGLRPDETRNVVNHAVLLLFDVLPNNMVAVTLLQGILDGATDNHEIWHQ
jgi:hypothetical protein